MKLTVYASELSACIAMHRFQQPWEAALKIFERTSPSDFRAAFARSGLEVPPSVASRALKGIQAGQVLAQVKDAIQGPVKDLDAKMQEIVQKADLSNVEFADDLRTFIFTERGKCGEKAVVDDFEKSHNVVLTERNDTFFKKTFECDIHLVVLGGRVDGLSKDGRLVEVKNRQRRFFGRIPLYEQVQVMAYMALTGSKECEVIERFDGESRVKIVRFDENFWGKVVADMLAFARKMFLLLTDFTLQDDLVRNRKF